MQKPRYDEVNHGFLYWEGDVKGYRVKIPWMVRHVEHEDTTSRYMHDAELLSGRVRVSRLVTIDRPSPGLRLTSASFQMRPGASQGEGALPLEFEEASEFHRELWRVLEAERTHFAHERRVARRAGRA